jgi:hypothetical protein
VGLQEADCNGDIKLKGGEMPTTTEYSLFGANAYGGPVNSQLKHDLPGSWKRMNLPVAPVYLDNPVTGFRAHVYQNETTQEVVIACAGSDLSERGDRSAIGEIIVGRMPVQVNDALNIYGLVNTHLNSKRIRAQISFTGHSLGGALAQYMAIAAQGFPAETFGAPGILHALGSLKGDYNPGYPYPVVNHVALGDPIGMIGTHLGTTNYFALDAVDFIMPVAMHYLIRRLVVAGLLTYHGHSVDRYFNTFHRPGETVKPTGKKTYQNGKTYERFKRFNGSGMAKDDYI